MIREAIVKLVNKENLTYSKRWQRRRRLKSWEEKPIDQISTFLTAMTMKRDNRRDHRMCQRHESMVFPWNAARMFKSSEPAEINPIPSTSPQQHPL